MAMHLMVVVMVVVLLLLMVKEASVRNLRRVVVHQGHRTHKWLHYFSLLLFDDCECAIVGVIVNAARRQHLRRRCLLLVNDLQLVPVRMKKYQHGVILFNQPYLELRELVQVCCISASRTPDSKLFDWTRTRSHRNTYGSMSRFILTQLAPARCRLCMPKAKKSKFRKPRPVKSHTDDRRRRTDG